MALYSLPIAYLAELMLGLPVLMIFRYYRVTSLAAFGACGALIGLLVALVMAIPAGTPIWEVLNPFAADWFTSYNCFFVLAASASAVLFHTILHLGGPRSTHASNI